MAVAKFLEKHPKVERVHYPGLKSHPDHALAKKQMRGFGGMLAFDLKGGLPAARRFCDRVRLFLLAASLGGVESLVILPIYSSHYNMSNEELRRAGVSPGTVRVSLGLEDKEDLIKRFETGARLVRPITHLQKIRVRSELFFVPAGAGTAGAAGALAEAGAAHSSWAGSKDFTMSSNSCELCACSG